MRQKRIVWGVVGGLASLLVVASPALALNTPSYWNRSSTPLVVNGYGSTAQGYGYIKIMNGSNGTRLYSYAWNKFYDADNHAGYLEGKTQYNAGKCAGDNTSTVQKNGVEVSGSSSCAAQFYDDSDLRQNGLNYTSSAWTAMGGYSDAVHSGADRGRINVRMKIDVPMRYDPSSGAAQSAADTW